MSAATLSCAACGLAIEPETEQWSRDGAVYCDPCWEARPTEQWLVTIDRRAILSQSYLVDLPQGHSLEIDDETDAAIRARINAPIRTGQLTPVATAVTADDGVPWVSDISDPHEALPEIHATDPRWDALAMPGRREHVARWYTSAQLAELQAAYALLVGDGTRESRHSALAHALRGALHRELRVWVHQREIPVPEGVDLADLATLLLAEWLRHG